MSDDHISDRTPPNSDGQNPIGSSRASVTPTIDDVFDLLANADRREVCLYLMDQEAGVVTVDRLVSALCDPDSEKDPRRYGIDLHHRHLPKLADAGIIDYDSRSNTARYWGQPTVEKWAEHVEVVDRNADTPQQ